MDYVESLNLFGVEACQIPCIKGNGAPTKATKGAVGCLYMDTVTGDMYKCTAVVGSVYTWKKVVEVEEDKIISKVESKSNNQYANALKGTKVGSVIDLTGNDTMSLGLSPFEHDIVLKLHRRNFYNCENAVLQDNCGVTLTRANGKTILNGTVDDVGMDIYNELVRQYELPEPESLYNWWVFSIQSLGGMITSGELSFVLEFYEAYRDGSTLVEGRIYKNTSTGKLVVKYDANPAWFRPGEDDWACVTFHASPGTVFDNFSFACQWENADDNVATNFVPFINDLRDVPVELSDVLGSIKKTYAPDENCTCVIKSSDPDCDYGFLKTSEYLGVIIECEYIKDTNWAIDELINAIISLGGNV